MGADIRQILNYHWKNLIIFPLQGGDKNQIQETCFHTYKRTHSGKHGADEIC